MNNEREILAKINNSRPENDMFLLTMTSSDIAVVKSLVQVIYGCFEGIKS